MKVIKKYQAFDGQVFDTEADALEHEQKLSGLKVIKMWMELRGITLEDWEAEQVLAFVNLMTCGPNYEFQKLMAEAFQSDDESGG